MKFNDIYVNQQERFSLGREDISGEFYISFPVTNGLCDYEEFYKIDKELIDNYPNSIIEIKKILKLCRDRKLDQFLFIQPGKNRGIPM